MAVGAVQAKGDRDMVSEIDFAVEERVRTFLQKETPEIGFLGEESGGEGAGGALTWALDPVDGTANLVSGVPLCGVSLGLIADSRSVLGVIDLPFLGQRYRAVEGHGAYCGDDRIRPRGTTALHEAIVAIGDYAVGERADERNARRLALTARLAGAFSASGCSARPRSTWCGWPRASSIAVSRSAITRGTWRRGWRSPERPAPW